MSYPIKTVSEKLHLPISTIRYYDKEGLLPFVERKASGYRDFSDNDVAMLEVIECLKRTGLSIKDIKQFSAWVKLGDASLKERLALFVERRTSVEAQIKELQASLSLIAHKVDYYQKALEAGTEAIHAKPLLNQDKK